METDMDQNKNRNRNIAIGCAIVFVFFAGMLAFIGLLQFQFQKKVAGRVFPGGGFSTQVGSGGDRIGLIYISGVIHAGRSTGSFLSEDTSGSDSLVRILDRVSRDDGVKAIVIRVNSPGGSAAASQEIYKAVKEAKKHGKLIVVSMGDVAASGGYYVSAPADVIFADPATLTGSIGVIASFLNYQGLFEKLGLSETTIKSVEHKDIGSPYREMTQAEKEILQKAIDGVHEQFIRDVAEGRGIKLKDVVKIADGSVYTGEQAIEIKLVDKLGGLQDAIEYAAKKTGLGGVPKIDYLQSDRPFSFLLGALSEIKPDLLQRNPLGSVADTMLLNPFLSVK
jgi:protease IV